MIPLVFRRLVLVLPVIPQARRRTFQVAAIATACGVLVGAGCLVTRHVKAEARRSGSGIHVESHDESVGHGDSRRTTSTPWQPVPRRRENRHTTPSGTGSVRRRLSSAWHSSYPGPLEEGSSRVAGGDWREEIIMNEKADMKGSLQQQQQHTGRSSTGGGGGSTRSGPSPDEGNRVFIPAEAVQPNVRNRLLEEEASEGGSSPHLVSEGFKDATPEQGTDEEREGGGSEEDLEPGEQEQGPVSLCSPLEVVGLERCPEWDQELVETMLELKRDVLRRVVDLLSDPASAGVGGHPQEPLLLVRKLALDETDAIFGAFEARFLGYATDSGGWSPEPGGLNRWVHRYYERILQRSRPVIISVHVSYRLPLAARSHPGDVPKASHHNTGSLYRTKFPSGKPFLCL